MITSGSALATASATESGSSASTMTGSAPSARSTAVLAAERVVPTTWWPRATRWGTRWRPIAPEAPAMKIFMTSPFVSLPTRDETLQHSMSGSNAVHKYDGLSDTADRFREASFEERCLEPVTIGLLTDATGSVAGGTRVLDHPSFT